MTTVADLYDDDLDAFESDLEDARMQADSDWDEKFVYDMRVRYDQYQGRHAGAARHSRIRRAESPGDLSVAGMLSPQHVLPLHRELVVDLFAGGGGASMGIEQATGRPVDVAINHDLDAIALHAANHPQAMHYTSDVFEVDPLDATDGQPVGLLWASPSCTHFSRARGGVPVSRQLRSLGWVVVRWAAAVKPRVIICENVPEWLDWGPVVKGKPCQRRRGQTFRQWAGHLERLGYRVEHRELVAADYGAPIRWPAPTHAKGGAGGLKRWRTAAECIDWSLPCPSIFERARPLADATMRRIARGVMRYVVEAAEPFIVPLRGTSSSHTSGGGKHALVAAFLAKHYTGVVGAGLRDPMPTITSVDHNALVLAHMIPTKDRMALVTVTIAGQPYVITDIGMRMLAPHELFRAQGFPRDYIIDVGADGRRMTKTAQVRMVGNSVCPDVARAVVAANYQVDILPARTASSTLRATSSRRLRSAVS